MRFDFNEQTIDVIAQGLGLLPFYKAAPVLKEIQRQVDEQQQNKNPEEITIQS